MMGWTRLGPLSAQTILQFQAWYLSEPYKSTRIRPLRGEFEDIASLTPEQATSVEDVVDQLEFLGMLVDRQLLDYEVVAVFYRFSPPRVWRSAAPFVINMRSEVPGYGRYLEKLAQRACTSTSVSASTHSERMAAP
jgi:hypothetical protein